MKEMTVGIVRPTVAIDLKLISKDFVIVEMKKKHILIVISTMAVHLKLISKNYMKIKTALSTKKAHMFIQSSDRAPQLTANNPNSELVWGLGGGLDRLLHH